MNAHDRITINTRHPHKNAGLSLFEIILVMAIIVGIGAFVMPSFGGMLEGQRLRKSADVVRVSWNNARIRSMKSGSTMVFRCEVGGTRFLVEPWAGGDQFLEQGEIVATPVFGIAGDGDTANISGVGEDTLPEGIVFAGTKQGQDARSLAIIQQLTDAPPAISGQWSEPILFYPDGSTSQAQLQLSTPEMQRFVLVQLRGLTGIATVTDIITQSDLAILLSQEVAQ
tara:strand:+ start:135 stop:812 length:678 start_codon:yes stop_codon:yes gene_type:complete